MFPIIATLVFGAPAQFPSAVYPYYETNRLIETADAIVVVEYIGYAGQYDADVVTADDNGNIIETIRTGTVDRHIFRPKLIVKGEVGQQITGVKFEGRSTPYGPDLFSKDMLYLMALYRPFGANRLLGTGGGGIFFRCESSDQWRFGTPSQVPTLPLGDYAAVGATPHERVSAVLVQAYEHDPKAVFVVGLEFSAQRHPARAEILPEYASFYLSTLEPRLLQVAGEDPERKSQVLKTSAVITGDPGYRRFWEFLHHFDATAEPDATVWLAIPARNADASKLMDLARNARTAAARAAATRALIRQASEERKDFFISLLSDPNQQVRVAALLWLDELQPAPNLRVKRTSRDVIENEEELIRYWQGR